MAPPSPHECAKYLGLSPGINGPPGKPLTSDEEDRTPLPRMFNSHAASTKEEKDHFNVQFIASYLPSFFRTLTQNTIDLELKSRPGDMQATWWTLVMVTFKELIPYPSFKRFFRDDPSRGRELYVFVYRAIGSLPPHMFDRSSGEEWEPFIVVLLSYIDSLMMDIPSVYSSFDYPDLDRSICSSLRRVHPFLLDLEAHLPADASYIKGKVKVWAQLVKQFGEGQTMSLQMMETKDESVRSGLSHAWWACEFSLNKAKKGQFECSDRGVMMACGRCRSVRYCSKEHQKLDWKDHKRLCFEPSW